MSNVINFDREKEIPNDLISFKKCAEIEGCSVGYLYSLYYSGKIKRHKKGVYKISLSEVQKAQSEVS
jgi:hypothetical protein